MNLVQDNGDEPTFRLRETVASHQSNLDTGEEKACRESIPVRVEPRKIDEDDAAVERAGEGERRTWCANRLTDLRRAGELIYPDEERKNGGGRELQKRPLPERPAFAVDS